MMPRLLSFLLALAVAHLAVGAVDPKAAPAGPTPASAPTVLPATTVTTVSAAAPTTSFDAFRVIGERNIFNPNRTGRRERSPEDAAPRLDILTLVGTMNSDKGLVAFFEGSESAYRKALHTGESIAQFKVTEIRGEGIDLERDGKKLPVRVGQQLRRPEGADWTLAAGEAVRSDAPSAKSSSVNASPTGTAPAIPADASDTLKKLMEQRQKSLKQ